jgi:hypothetical protein
VSTAEQDPGIARAPVPMPVDPLERALLIDKMRQLLTDPREKVRSTGRRVLHRTLQLVRLAKGHKWAALAGEGGHHRLAQFHLTDLASKIAMTDLNRLTNRKAFPITLNLEPAGRRTDARLADRR